MLDLGSVKSRALFALSALLIGAFIFFPIYWMAATALKPSFEAFRVIPSLLPMHPTLSNFTEALHQSPLGRYIKNSLIAAGLGATLSTVLGSYAAYGLAMFRFTGARTLMFVFLASQMFPFALILVSLYPMLQNWHLTNTYLGLIISYAILSLPASVYIMHSYFSKLPPELLEAARVDGCGEFRAFHSIVAQASRPGIIAVWLFAFMWGWNDLLFSLTLVTSQHLRMLGPGLLGTYLGEFRDNWGGIMAASLIASAPIVAAFAVLQRSFVRGLMAGAVKG